MFRTISIPTDNVKSFSDRIAKLNKRAVKLNVPAIVLNITGTELKKFGGQGYKPYFVEFTNIEINGDDPVIEGHRLIAAIDHDNVLGTMIKVVPGMELPVQYRESNGSCDHCHTKRNRKRTIVVQHVESGKYLEIGRQCVRDFLKSDRIDRYTCLESFIKSVDDMISEYDNSFNDGSGRYEPIHNLTHVLACSINSISEFGYISSTYARENSTEYNPITSTCSRMWTMLYGNKYNQIAPYTPTDEEMTEAASIAEWVKTVNPDSDYNYSILQIGKAGLVKDKYMGWAVSIVSAYRRAMGLIKAKAVSAAKPASEYVGVVGKREEFKLVYVGEYSFSTSFGYATIYRFRNGENNNVVWMSANRIDFVVGNEYDVVGSVKKHEIYRDEKQTSLTRVKVKGI